MAVTVTVIVIIISTLVPLNCSEEDKFVVGVPLSVLYFSLESARMSTSVAPPIELSDQDYRKLISKALTKVNVYRRAE